MTARRFELHRSEDVTGVSGTGIVAEGVEYSDGVVSLHWTTEWPSSVVHYERGRESVEAVHCHNGLTKIVFLDHESAVDLDETSPFLIESLQRLMDEYGPAGVAATADDLIRTGRFTAVAPEPE